MRFFDCFAGIGGFRIGLERVGFKCVGSCEIDKYASKLYHAYFDTKGEFYEDDIRNIECKKLPEFEMLVGGFPCQAFSISGKQRGFDDVRGLLFFELARIAKFKKPQFLFFENVKNLLHHEKGKTFEKILLELWKLGYDVEYATLNSKDFNLPQNRERVFIVGHLRKRSRTKILPILKSLKSFSNLQEQEATTNTIVARYGASCSSGTYIIENSIVPQKVGIIGNDSQGNRVYDTSLAITLKASSGGFGGKTGLYKVGERIRRLTPLECFRLQGFSDDMVELAKKLEISDTQLYKMVGNAVSVNVIEAIAKEIKKKQGGNNA